MVLESNPSSFRTDPSRGNEPGFKTSSLSPISFIPDEMCRLLAFDGKCTCCGQEFTWDDLSQELSCLEAKNAGVFGECRRGIHKEEHRFDQECDECLARNGADEGYGEWEGETAFDDLNSGKEKKGDDKHEQHDVFYSSHEHVSERTNPEEDGRRSKRQRIS